ncbi:helix-turn-helix domain-containing protein [Candidatus Bathyarchaeota archaeon]|nr:helix-turn-helix domain-containing protein [Candidatus Bathyarchaeota archaeon]
MADLAKRLGKSGKVAEVCAEKSRAFDIAYAGERAYLIKIVRNIESVNKEQAETIKKCASVVGAEPLFISDHGKLPLKKNVVYTRHGIPVMRHETFLQVAHGNLVSMADRGGIKVPIRDLTPAMKKVGMSRMTLAKLLGVSTEMVRKYERGLADPGRDVARRLVNIFGQNILREVKYESPDVRRAFIGKAPFDLAVKRKKPMLISFKSSPKRVKNLEGVSDVLDAEPIVAKNLDDLDLD